MSLLEKIAKHAQRLDMQKKGLKPHEIQGFELFKKLSNAEMRHLKIVTEKLLELSEREPLTKQGGTKEIYQELGDYLHFIYENRRSGTLVK